MDMNRGRERGRGRRAHAKSDSSTSSSSEGAGTVCQTSTDSEGSGTGDSTSSEFGEDVDDAVFSKPSRVASVMNSSTARTMNLTSSSRKRDNMSVPSFGAHINYDFLNDIR